MNTYKYDIDAITKIGDVQDEKRDKIKVTTASDMPFSSNFQSGRSGGITSNYNKYERKGYIEDKATPTEEFVKLISTFKSANAMFENVNASIDIEFSNGNTTVERIRGDDSTKVCFTVDKIIDYTDIVEVTFIVNKADGFNVFIGFVEDGESLLKGASATNNSWLVYLNGGRLNNGPEKGHLKPYVKPDKDNAIFTIMIDTKTDEIWLKINGAEETDKVKLIITDEQKKKLKPVVDFRKIGDKITIH